MDFAENRDARQMKRGRSRRTRYHWLAGAVASMLCWPLAHYGSAVAWARHGHSTAVSAPAIGARAVDFELKLLDGKSIRLEQFRGKPVILNFFASWCDPCREEMPLINEIAAAGGKRGYEVIGIAVEDTRAAVLQFSKETKLVFPIGLDLNSTVKRAYRIFCPPFFIDAQGTVRDIVLGPVTPETLRQGLKKSGVS